MSRAARWILIAVLASGLPLGQAALAGDANLLYGQKSLGEERFDVAGVDGQTQFGVKVNRRGEEIELKAVRPQEKTAAPGKSLKPVELR